MVDDPLYLCHHCRDVGVVLRERFRSDGRPIGTFASPCHDCRGGDEQRAEWAKNGLLNAARENERSIQRLEDILKSGDPNAKAERWRSAARSAQEHREKVLEQRRELKPIGGNIPAAQGPE